MSDYEQRLGTQKMLPLIFSMSLPAVAAQLVNLLYSIIDRVYIGHIPEGGTDALAGIGITSSIIVLIAAFAQIVGSGGIRCRCDCRDDLHSDFCGKIPENYERENKIIISDVQKHKMKPFQSFIMFIFTIAKLIIF